MAGSGPPPHSSLDWSRRHEKGQTHGRSTREESTDFTVRAVGTKVCTWGGTGPN